MVSSEQGKKTITPPHQQTPKLKVLTTLNERQPSKAKTRIKKRKVSQEPTKVEVESEDGDEEDQPPLKRVKLRLAKAPTPSSGSGRNNKVASASKLSAGKAKSVTAVSPVKTSMRRRARDQQPRTASVVWPKMDKPIFDQVTFCCICLPDWMFTFC